MQKNYSQIVTTISLLKSQGIPGPNANRKRYLFGLSLVQACIHQPLGFILREKHKGYHKAFILNFCHGEKKHLKIGKKKSHLYHRDKKFQKFIHIDFQVSIHDGKNREIAANFLNYMILRQQSPFQIIKQNHRIAWAGRDPKVPTPPPAMGCLPPTRSGYSQPQATWPWAAPRMGHPQLLCAFSPSSLCPHSRS